MTEGSSLFSVEGRIAVVTGASAGIGRALASALCDAGAKVVGIARRVEALNEWQNQAPGHRAVIAADLSVASGLEAVAEQAALPFGPPDILVSAAGVNFRQPAGDVTIETWATTLDVNVTAPFFLARALVPAMKAKGWGRIVNFGSMQTFRAFPDGIAYGASKGGVGQLTRAMAEAWSRFGITTNAIAPGFVPSEMTDVVFADKERAERNAAQTCIGRNGTTGDLIGPTLFLCSRASDYVTGQILNVDGGFSAK